ncbi:phosphoribosylformylglycinamidine synthase, small subunit [Deferribacter desulfuricans SSM1]|uniref:Phosphoribosylformylglycinamidine synthase subunit PurS n=1 Tax=Deferribacter desulfuricans (strain DSM 14783 / JCM 11476 / NBRC 101012 / SSM1) TaxID=639282 RepID=D3P8M4_DEFDS|nr:phosphoribosylformylglycinamidine synthase subunit PurS [Deferribacter desulfuricans]BAI81064.1 phosphoribosylformylglycinamidine synthase, small subunit [Deferribacter desulfuricans SSM1]
MPKVRVQVKLKDTVLDPQGQTVLGSLNKLGYEFVNDVRVGKIIELDVENIDNLDQKIVEVCEKLLVNPIVEEYSYEIIED